jgi:hypothetical protein
MTDNALTPYQAPVTPAPSERFQVPAIQGEFVRARLPEVGRIRCGEKETKTVTRGGKQVDVTYPKRLNTFRFTSRERSLIERVAELYGGEIKPWASDEGPQWQVTSEANSIEVIVPTADLAFSQYFELWDGGGCQRRCDGHYEMLGDRQCVCDPADRSAGKEGSCKPTTRLGVFLPGVKGLGVWRLESHGKNAGSEIKGSVMLIAAYGAGLTRATLTTAIRPGRQRKPDGSYTPVRYVVPTLIADDDIEQWVDRAQLEQSPVRGVLPSSHDYPDPRDDKMRELFATYREVKPHGDFVSPEEEREQRLDWSSIILGREITTWNGPEAPETLTRADVQVLLDELQAAPDPGPAAPDLSHQSATGADIHEGSAGTLPRHGPGQIEMSDLPTASRVEAPAEHVSEREGGLGEVTPLPSEQVAAGRVDQTVEAGSAAPIGDPVPAPAAPHRSDEVAIWPVGKPAAPHRKRTKPPAPSVAQVREAQKTAEQTRKQTTVDRPDANWLWTLRQPYKGNLLAMFHGRVPDAADFIAKIVSQDPDLPNTLAEWIGFEWPADNLEALMEAAKAETTLR